MQVLLRGRKRFRLYPAESARQMYTHGRVQTIHRNGRIVYAGQVSWASSSLPFLTN